MMGVLVQLEEVSIEEAYSYLRLPRVLRTIDHFDALADLAERRLMLAYGDLEAVWGDPYLREAFVCLPLDIVKVCTPQLIAPGVYGCRPSL